MKYIKKLPNADKSVGVELVSQGWTKLKEPSNLIISMLIALI